MRNAKKQTYKDALNKAWEISGRVILNIWRYVKYVNFIYFFINLLLVKI